MQNYEWEGLSDLALLAGLIDAGVPDQQARDMVHKRYRLQMRVAINEWMRQ